MFINFIIRINNIVFEIDKIQNLNIMPLVKIEIAKGESRQFLVSLKNITMDCIRTILEIPEDDRNIRVGEYDPELFSMKPPYRIIIQIIMFTGRKNDTKKRLYDHIVSTLSDELGIERGSILIVLNEQPMINWGIRGGLAADEVKLDYRVDI